MGLFRKLIYFISLLVLAFVLFKSMTFFSGNTKEELTIYVGLSDDHAIKVIEAFERETGIKTHYISLSNGEILTRILNERESPTSSVWYGGPVDTFIQAKREGLLR